ncbi:MAG: hypothetical protein IJH79_12750, partial [Lentisphaeria bacterium]|nr:hypothetical protein [Lentisphaeria bacterium]
AEPGIGMLQERTCQHAFVIVIEGHDLAVGSEDGQPGIQLGAELAGEDFADDLFAFFNLDNELVDLGRFRDSALQEDG